MLIFMPVLCAYLRKLFASIMLLLFVGTCIVSHTLIAMDNHTDNYHDGIKVTPDSDSDDDIVPDDEREHLLYHSESDTELDNNDTVKKEVTHQHDPNRAGPLLPDDSQTNRSCLWTAVGLTVANLFVGGIVLAEACLCSAEQNGSALCKTLQPTISPLLIALGGTNALTISGVVTKRLHEWYTRSQPATQPPSSSTAPTATALVDQTKIINNTQGSGTGIKPEDSVMMI
jgi:hypothetical protein